MARMIFINLPVRDLDASTRFFTNLGFDVNREYSDDTATCLVIEQNICVMLLAEAKFREFINGDIADPATTEVLTGVTTGSRAEVDELVRSAIDAGGKPWKPAVSVGPMYGGSFQDLDGHVWEVMAMDEPTA